MHRPAALCALSLILAGCASVSERLVDATVAWRTEEVSALLAKGGNPDAKDAEGKTLLMLAANSGNPELVKTLAEHKADVNARAQNGATALLMAVANSKNVPVVKLLLEHKADANAKLPGGITALMTAVSAEGKPEIVKLLLAHGADVNARTEKGTTAYKVAVNSNRADLAKLLLKAGARAERPSAP